MEKKKYFKDGNPEVFRYFNEMTWSNMTIKEKSMWTPFTEDNKAPIPKEVIDFEKKAKAKTAKEIPAEAQDERVIIIEELRRMGVRFAYNTGLEKLKEKLEKEKANAANTE